MRWDKRFITKYPELNKELKNLYYEMKKANYTEEEIRKKFAPIMAKLPKERDMFFITVCTMFTFTMTVFFVAYWDTFYWHLAAIARIFLVNLLPYYDWSYLKDEPCLIPKMHIFEKEIPIFYQNDVAFNCHTCSDLENVKVFENIDEDILIKKYVETDIPIVLKKGLDHWKYDVKDFLQKISSKNEFWYSHPCKLSTNIHNDEPVTVGKLFEKTTLFESFFMHFRNCETPSKRVFRNFTYRPDYLPEVYSPTVENWLIWTKNYSNMNYRKVELTEKITVMGQIHGRSYVRLLPRKNCEYQCPILEFELNMAEYVIFTPLWDLEYRESENGENLAAILEVRG